MVRSFLFSYLPNNIMGNWNAGTANVLPALLTTWSNLIANTGNKTQYELYKEQAKAYVDAAKDNAQLIKNQGEIALRNLKYKHTLEQGSDVVKAAVSGGGLGGSKIDVILRKEKIRKMDEATLKANYTNQAMLEIVNGYRNAGHVYGTMAQKAQADKWSVLASVLKGVETYVGLSVRDAKIEAGINAGYQKVEDVKQETIKFQDEWFGVINKDKEKAIDLEMSNPVSLFGDDYSMTETGIIPFNN